jgi:glycosyltransferase involved in cell wall biosynthesis
MRKSSDFLLSVVVPLHNEAAGLTAFHASLVTALQPFASYEILYCDDGSTDETAQVVRDLAATNSNIKLLCFSRNFGKENALTAGLTHAAGEAIITIDGDGQHPVELIPEFVAAWQAGNQVVIGVRKTTKEQSSWKQWQSRLFYKVFNKLSEQKLIPGSTDFRLIDRQVQQAFLQLNESDRITRGLIDWLGFKRHLITFTPKRRQHGEAAYSQRKLMVLAVNSFVSLTRTPLYLFGYLGVIITIFSFVLGLAVFVEQLLLGDPLQWNFTGTAMLGILILFLVGIVLLSQGILSLYISLLHNQSKQRPLYVIDYQASAGIKKVGHGAN